MTIWHTVLVSVSPPPHPHHPIPTSLTRELKNSIVGFVLKELVTYFEMLIVPNALHCVDDCAVLYFTSFDTACHTILIPVSDPPPPQKKKIRFRFFVKTHLLESSKLDL